MWIEWFKMCHFYMKLKSKLDKKRKRFRTTSIGGPPWNQVVKRVKKVRKGKEQSCLLQSQADIETTLYFRPSTRVKEANHVCDPSASKVSKSSNWMERHEGGDALMYPAEPTSSSKRPAWDKVHPPRLLPPEVATPRPVRVGEQERSI